MGIWALRASVGIAVGMMVAGEGAWQGGGGAFPLGLPYNEMY